MKTVILPVLAGWAFFTVSCDLFSTVSVTPKPENINSYENLFSAREEIRYRMEERILPDDGEPIPVSSYRVRFSFLEEVEEGDLTWALFEMKVEGFESGNTIFNRIFRGRIDFRGARYLPDTAGSGPRFFLLKTSPETGGPDLEFETLPGLLMADSDTRFSRGSFTFKREITGSLDTLEFSERLEEAWLVKETVQISGTTVATGVYTYGQSGLLACVQNFPGFNHRSSLGESLGQGTLERRFTLLEEGT